MELSFEIKTVAELAGAEATARSLEMQIGKAKALGEDYSELDSQLRKVNASLEAVNPELSKHAEQTAEAGLKYQELNKIMTALGNAAVPGLGSALSELASGPVGVALVLVEAYKKLRENIEGVEKEAEKLDDEELAKHSAAVNGLNTSWDNAAKAYGDYLAKLQTAGEDNDPIKKQIDRAKELVIARLEGEKQIQEALAKTEIAQLRASGAGPAAIATAEARNQVGRDSIQNSIDLTNGSTGLMLELSTRQAAQPTLEADAEQKAAAARAADAKYKADEARLIEDNAKTDASTPAGKALKKKLDDDAEAIEAAKLMPDEGPPVDGSPGADLREQKAQAIKEAEDKAKADKAEYNNTIRDRSRLEDSEIDRSKARATADDQAKAAEDAAQTNAGRLKQIPGELDQAQKVEDIKDHTRKVTEILNTHGGALNESLGQLAAATGKTHEQTIAIVERILNHTLNLGTVLAQLTAQAQQQADANARAHYAANFPQG